LIIDGHNYCVPELDSKVGYNSLEQKMKLLQAELGGHSQPVWNIKNRVMADNSTLINSNTGELRNIEWTRVNGALAWSIDGETYTKQYLPPMLHNLECPPEVLIREMDYAGVDIGLLHTYPMLGAPDYLNNYLNNAVQKFPDRLRRLISIRESDLITNLGKVIETLEKETKLQGVSGLQFIPGFYYQGLNNNSSNTWNSKEIRPFWDAIYKMNLPVYFTLIGGRGSKLYERSWMDDYMDEQRILLEWLNQYSGLNVVVTHGLPWTAGLENGKINFPEEIWDIFKSPNCNLQILIPIQMGAKWEYPWKESEPIIKLVVERIGANRIIWGTDMPMVARFCTYKQALDQFRVHCNFLSDSEREDIIGRTAARVMNINN
jgi:predicted TIM-barrel fold metal-dependent hydrolase